MGERILEEEPAKLQVTPAVPTTTLHSHHGHHFPQVVAQDQARVHLGDVYNVQTPRSVEVKSLGWCLSSAPLIKPADFVGRTTEIDAIRDSLRPGEASVEQRRVVLGGMGGIGKTQLAIAYARAYRSSYSSVLWLNATSESTLHASIRSLARGLAAAQELARLTDEQACARLQEWLSYPDNTNWLLVFDNHDDPEQFMIDNYCPNTSHGAIIITTRLPDLVTGEQVRVQPLLNFDDGLNILQTRSARADIWDDIGARRLVQRLAGLPLALVTAGAYLRKSTITFEEYLVAYKGRWEVDPRRPLRLQEYQDRTLYTTWNLSYNRLQKDDFEASQMLKLLAYFDHQEIWYELMQAGLSDESPVWLQHALSDVTGFSSVMSTLVDYCLVEVQHASRSYSMHSCVHDWALGELNRAIDLPSYWYTFDCVAAAIGEEDWEVLGKVQYARISAHSVRLTHSRFEREIDCGLAMSNRHVEAEWIGELLKQQVQLAAAEWMYMRALAGTEKALGLDHTSTLDTVNNLGNLYADQGKLDEAKRMYLRALAGREKALGPDHTSTLDTVNNLGILYRSQGKLDEAEQMYIRALAGTEKALGLDHTSTLSTVNNLGLLYADQGKLDEAEQMYIRALAGREKALGADHTSTLDTVNNLGILYRNQGKLDEAEQMYIRALAGREKVLGPDHTSTLDTVNNLGNLYRSQGKLDVAEQMYMRALAGKEKALGPDHTSTLDAKHCLADLGQLLLRPGRAERRSVSLSAIPT